MGKKHLKKLIVLMLSAMLVIGSAVSASAATSPSEGGTTPAATATLNQTIGSIANKSMKVTYTGKNASSYKVAYMKADGQKKWVNKASKTKTYNVTGLKTNGLYQFKVAGVNKDGKTGKYSKISYRFIQTSKPTLTAGSKKITVKATTKGATGYQIRYSTNKNMSGAKTIVVTKKTLNQAISSLKSGKTYYVQVRPFKAYDGHRYYGIYSGKKAVKVK